ncbi:fluoride efflux transporter FluC [Mycobacterium montefiorense]|uniref:fluoride efflux transporter FluC n=1 Tax=Mycobacterium montefiorense TaxID=154654 RepID=UPI0021F2C7BD|nr:CrcB family protein [Mycobacterium montefiorense]MCV7426131.1 CrcB family protein [Mycobacterium montefiorense]
MSDTHSELPTDPDATASPQRSLSAASLWVFVGGAAGTALRVAVEDALLHDCEQWPWATLLINLVGAFVLGALLEGLVRTGDDSRVRQRIRYAFGTGGCGAFTTYSTLSLDISLLARSAHVAAALGYGLASVLGGMATAWLGTVVAAGVHRRRSRR